MSQLTLAIAAKLQSCEATDNNGLTVAELIEKLADKFYGLKPHAVRRSLIAICEEYPCIYGIKKNAYHKLPAKSYKIKVQPESQCIYGR